MLLYRRLLLVIVLSFLLAEKSGSELKQKKPIMKNDPVTIWQEEDNEVMNVDLKIELEKLRDEFEIQRKTIQKKFKAKIEPYKHQRDMDISALKKDFIEMRKAFKKKYGVKPKKVNNDKNKAYPDKPMKVKKANKNPLKSKQDNQSKKVLPIKEKEVPPTRSIDSKDKSKN